MFAQHLRRWRIVLAAGALIIASWITAGVVGDEKRILGALSWADLFMLAAAVVAGFSIVRSAISALAARQVGVDALVSTAAIGAIAIGNYWEAAAVTFLFVVGGALESATLATTRSAISELIAIAPTQAEVYRDGQLTTVPASAVRTGEVVVIKNGGKIPVDAEVIDGSAAVEQAAITGESVPAEKRAGEQVYAGTIVQRGFLKVRATGVGADTTLARIIHRVEQAQEAKAPTQTYMERFSRWYTPAIIVLALISGLITRNLELALTLLVIGCPGALVISIPVTVVSGIGRAARDGILIKGGEFLETAAKIDAIALDKTGTLTRGRPVLTDLLTLTDDIDDRTLLTFSARAEAGSEHPLAHAIVHAAQQAGITPTLPEQVESAPGKGVCATIDSHRVLIGNGGLMEEYRITENYQRAAAAAERLAERGRTPMIIALDERVVGVIAVADTLREQATETIAELRELGIDEIVMLTGDNQAVARAIGDQVGISTIHAALLPEDKLTRVSELRANGYTVAMVGDGVNDAPALVTADIGIAMGAAGSAATVETADIALMADQLPRLPRAISLAQRTRRVMRQNIAIALLTVALLLAGVFAGGVTMALGMLFHEASVLVVIANAMRLLRVHRVDRADDSVNVDGFADSVASSEDPAQRTPAAALQA